MRRQVLVNSLRDLCVAFNLPPDGRRFEEKLVLFNRVFGTVSDSIFQQACDYLVENAPKFPAISDVKRTIMDLSASLRGGGRSMVPCAMCNGYGEISAFRLIDGKFAGEYVFRCSCENGAGINLPDWNDDVRSNGFVPADEYNGLSSWDKEQLPFIAPAQEQKARVDSCRAILRLIAGGMRDRAMDRVIELDQRIDRYRKDVEHERTAVAQGSQTAARAGQ